MAAGLHVFLPVMYRITGIPGWLLFPGESLLSGFHTSGKPGWMQEYRAGKIRSAENANPVLHAIPVSRFADRLLW